MFPSILLIVFSSNRFGKTESLHSILHYMVNRQRVMTPLRKRRSFYGFSPMLSHPRANFTVSVVSLLQCSNFYVEDFPQQPASQSFKEPQSPSPVAIEAARHIAIRMAPIIAEFA